MRRRRPARLRECVDREATAARHFLDKNSYIAIDGREIYEGQDAVLARFFAWCEWDGICGLCGKPMARGEKEDWDHIQSKGKNLRDDHPRNRQFVHGMFSAAGCHRKKHNREPQLGRADAPN